MICSPQLAFVLGFFITLLLHPVQPLLRSSPPISLNNKHNLQISSLVITNAPANGIQLLNCTNITIRNCSITKTRGNAVTLINCKNITVTNCYAANVATGVYAVNSQGIAVINNRVKNVQGPFPRGQMVQFDHVTGAGNRIAGNVCENILGESNAEDAISLYKTHGTASDPVMITGNKITGGGPSASGGGIMLGDNGGSYLVASKNILVNPGQYGMGIAGGTHIQLTDNVIYSKKQPFTNVGIYVWAQNGVRCDSNTVTRNKVNWANKDGQPNPGWKADNSGLVAGWENNQWGAAIQLK